MRRAGAAKDGPVSPALAAEGGLVSPALAAEGGLVSPATAELLGRGAREGRRLFEGWYAELTASAVGGRPAAYVFVMGSLAELLRSFDLAVVFPEINSLQTAVRHVAADYLSLAEDHGFSPDVCGYVKADYALQLRKGEHPMGRIPPPAIAVLTNACNTYIKWAEIWERLHGIPVCTIDVPMSRRAPGGALGVAGNGRPDRGDTAAERITGAASTGPISGEVLESPGLERDLRYVEGQLRELIATCEEVSGRAFDLDRLREAMAHANEMGRQWRRLLELNRRRPAPFDAMLEGTIYLGVANALRGTPEGAAYFRDLVEEMEGRVDAGLGPLGAPVDPEAEHRLAFVGVPCYPIFRRFYELFSEWGGTFVGSTYTWFASGGLHLDFEYDLGRPVESLAEGLLRGVRAATDALMYQDRALVEAIDAYGIDGVVYHPVKSCRTVSTGLADSRRAILDARDVLCLYIESDMMDQRVVSEAQLKNRIDAFFEGLESRRRRRREEDGSGP